MKSIVNQIFDIAKIENKSLKTISEASGVSVESLSRVKKRGRMTTDSIEKIACALGYEVQLRKVTLPRLCTSGSAWSSPSSRNEPRMLAARLSNSSFQDLVELCLINGVSNVESTMDKIKSEIPKKRYELQRSMLNNIKHALGSSRLISHWDKS